VLAGLWHGAAWGFVLWGAMHGAFLVAERAFGLERIRAFRGRWGAWWIVTRVWVILALVAFRAPDLATAGKFYSAMMIPTSFSVSSRILEPLVRSPDNGPSIVTAAVSTRRAAAPSLPARNRNRSHAAAGHRDRRAPKNVHLLQVLAAW
jgi:hypothetical protein